FSRDWSSDVCSSDLNRKPMYMKDWIARLDDFLRMTGNDVLGHAGTISHEQAVKKAEAEYAKYKAKTANELSKAEKDFVEFIDQRSEERRVGKEGRTT